MCPCAPNHVGGLEIMTLPAVYPDLRLRFQVSGWRRWPPRRLSPNWPSSLRRQGNPRAGRAQPEPREPQMPLLTQESPGCIRISSPLISTCARAPKKEKHRRRWPPAPVPAPPQRGQARSSQDTECPCTQTGASNRTPGTSFLWTILVLL